MDAKRRAMYGSLVGAASTLALSGLRELMNRAGLVHQTAPEQVVARLEDLGLIKERSASTRRSLILAAHYAYGAGAGAAFGLLRRERGGLAAETAVGSALGVLSWGAGWSTWLPLVGVHAAPWAQNTPRVLLPVADHAFFGAVWGIIHHLTSR